jgi:outer membrane protein TolC
MKHSTLKSAVAAALLAGACFAQPSAPAERNPPTLTDSVPSPAFPASTPQNPAPLLSLDEAIRLALQNNYSLALAHDQTGIASATRWGSAGLFLPSASASMRNAGAVDPEFESPSTDVSASANWIVFNGFQNYNAYRRSKAQEKAAQLQERATLEGLVENVIVAYYDLVQQKQRLASIRELLSVSQERARLAMAKLQVGAGSKLDQLQSLADLNADSSTYLNQSVSIAQAKVRFNQVLTRDPSTDFDVADSIPLEATLPLDAWRRGLPEHNASIAQAREVARSSKYSLNTARGQWLPQLSTGVTYSSSPNLFNASQTGAANREGMNYNVNISIPLFDRLQTAADVRRAKLSLRQDETRTRQAEIQAMSDFDQARTQYETSLSQTQLEERNLQVAKLQAEAALQRYKLGASSPLEFRDAQTRLLEAQGRLITSRQRVKQSETALQRLSGALIQQVPAAAARDSVSGGK